MTTVDSVQHAAKLLRAAPSPVVVVPVWDGYDDVVRCLDAIDATTPSRITLLIVDDGSHDERLPSLFARTGSESGRHVVVLRHRANEGYVRSCNDGFAATRGRDVVLVNSDLIVGEEWLERLTEAALSDASIATASTLTNHGTILSVPDRNTPAHGLPDGLTPTEAARRVAAAGRRSRPAIPTAVGHCCYVSRRALDLVGPFDETLNPGYGEEVDFSQRATALGFRHVCADDVFTFHRGQGTFGTSPVTIKRQLAHEHIVRHRYPWYAAAVEQAAADRTSPLADALGVARRALVGLTIGIDALSLGPIEMGTQHNVIETIRALADLPGIARLVVFVPAQLPPYAIALFDTLPAVDFVVANPFAWRGERIVDLVYRPYQVTQQAELDFLCSVADRFVVNQLDTIAFENPAYFANAGEWMAYRATTRLALAQADGVAFLSEHGRRTASSAGLLSAGQPTEVVGCGVVQRAVDDGDPSPPLALVGRSDGFVLCLGASYLHKNRPFALQVWRELRHRGWTGAIVLAGPTPPHGNSLERELIQLLDEPALAGDVVSLSAVSDREKRWLYQHASLVIYASSSEGFGLVPFEAAAHGVPTLASGLADGLAETLPARAPILNSFDVCAAADMAWTLLHDEQAMQGAIEAVRTRGDGFTWALTADRLEALFADVLQRPTHARFGVAENGTGVSDSRLAGRVANGGSRALEGVVRSVILRPALKERLSPHGSRRQQAARSAISRARRTFGAMSP